MNTTDTNVDDLVDAFARELGIAEPRHTHGDTPLTHVLNVARRNGSPYQPKHCGCPACRHGFTHIGVVSR